ncbi:MAG: esterase-like activity of phytase family protein [Prevotella sp.]|nr:esterase-like activity of phytase family protein [Prevotella sp.]
MNTKTLAATDSLGVVKVNKQRHFKQEVPAGNYSGLTPIGEGRYAVVSDKSVTDGFFVFEIAVDSIDGRVERVRNLGFRSDGSKNRDTEAIVFLPQTQTLMLAGEADGKVVEYDLQGRRTGRVLDVGATLKGWTGNYGLESLAYNEKTGLLWTCTESTLKEDGERSTSVNGVQNRIRLQSFDAALKPCEQYAYLTDAPKAHMNGGRFAHGVSELLALDDGSLLVLEREVFVAKRKIGSYVINKVYRIMPDKSLCVNVKEPLIESVSYVEKRLVASWKTNISLFGRKLANYEGMCLGPRTADGAQTIILVADSQDQYGGILRDWFKTILVQEVSGER